MTDCAEKIEYPSEFVADNAVILHRMSLPLCKGIEAYACGDHWHIGHPTPSIGDHCKAHSPTYRGRLRPAQQGAS